MLIFLKKLGSLLELLGVVVVYTTLFLITFKAVYVL